jgi:transcription initiation factor IIE alpha subunit
MGGKLFQCINPKCHYLDKFYGKDYEQTLVCPRCNGTMKYATSEKALIKTKKQNDTWWCCGVERPIDQSCSCGSTYND